MAASPGHPGEAAPCAFVGTGRPGYRLKIGHDACYHPMTTRQQLPADWRTENPVDGNTPIGKGPSQPLSRTKDEVT